MLRSLVGSEMCIRDSYMIEQPSTQHTYPQQVQGPSQHVNLQQFLQEQQFRRRLQHEQQQRSQKRSQQVGPLSHIKLSSTFWIAVTRSRKASCTCLPPRIELVS
eukprot:TRINITY_DN18166_c0_g1_i2.p3 TRINITY_DN18166_c0_g1~~TRINITY_DN18166_c0_g1_i2.p3  ORF type:complete len:119 (-),score=36.52 TRINITY_DN18166_c0_g1_i2:380-691(-)